MGVREKLFYVNMPHHRWFAMGIIGTQFCCWTGQFIGLRYFHGESGIDKLQMSRSEDMNFIIPIGLTFYGGVRTAYTSYGWGNKGAAKFMFVWAPFCAFLMIGVQGWAKLF